VRCAAAAESSSRGRRAAPGVPGTLRQEGQNRTPAQPPKTVLLEPRKNAATARGAPVADDALFMAVVVVSLQPI